MIRATEVDKKRTKTLKRMFSMITNKKKTFNDE